jgi:hypothetical protein
MNDRTMFCAVMVAVVIIGFIVTAIVVSNSMWWICHHPTPDQAQSISFAMQCYAQGVIDLNGQYIR